jgi:hypothetical protein
VLGRDSSIPQRDASQKSIELLVGQFLCRSGSQATFERQRTGVAEDAGRCGGRRLGRVIAGVAAVPKYLVTDSGVQFACAGFKQWCRRRGIRQRRGAVGRHGSIAVEERFIRTLTSSCVRVLSFVPLRLRAFRREVDLFFAWYNDRPHMTRQGATPDEIYFRRRPACRAPRFEPLLGTGIASAEVAHSFFFSVDGDGNIMTCSPETTRHY